MDVPEHTAPVTLPRVAITFCTQCRWMLRAAYFGQELLSTFGTSIGEIALIPATGGKFIVNLTYRPASEPESGPENDARDDAKDGVEANAKDPIVKDVVIWDYKVERCFPETKILKQKIRNFIDPAKSLGHSDTPSSKAKTQNTAADNADETPRSWDSVSSVSGTSRSMGVSTESSVSLATSVASSKPFNGPASVTEYDKPKNSDGVFNGKDPCEDCA